MIQILIFGNDINDLLHNILNIFNQMLRFDQNFYIKKKNIFLHFKDEPNPTARDAALEDVRKTADTFRSLIDEKFHQQLLARSERRMSHRALQGALMIMLY